MLPCPCARRPRWQHPPLARCCPSCCGCASARRQFGVVELRAGRRHGAVEAAALDGQQSARAVQHHGCQRRRLAERPFSRPAAETPGYRRRWHGGGTTQRAANTCSRHPPPRQPQRAPRRSRQPSDHPPPWRDSSGPSARCDHAEHEQRRRQPDHEPRHRARAFARLGVLARPAWVDLIGLHGCHAGAASNWQSVVERSAVSALVDGPSCHSPPGRYWRRERGQIDDHVTFLRSAWPGPEQERVRHDAVRHTRRLVQVAEVPLLARLAHADVHRAGCAWCPAGCDRS